MKNYKFVPAADFGRMCGELQSEIQLHNEAETELARTKQLLAESREREARLVAKNNRLVQKLRDAELREEHAARVIQAQHAVIGLNSPPAVVPPVWSQLRLKSGVLSFRVRCAGDAHFRQYACATPRALGAAVDRAKWQCADLVMRLAVAEAAGALSGAYLLELVSQARGLGFAIFERGNGVFLGNADYWKQTGGDLSVYDTEPQTETLGLEVQQ